MVAGQIAAAYFNFAQHTANHGAQGFLHDLIVVNQAVGHAIVHGPQVGLVCQWVKGN